MAVVSYLGAKSMPMKPMLADARCDIEGGAAPVCGTFATVAETEAMSEVALVANLQAAGVMGRARWARIGLTLQSGLSALGLTSAFEQPLADQWISRNVVEGYHHDRIFVAWADRDRVTVDLSAMTSA